MSRKITEGSVKRIIKNQSGADIRPTAPPSPQSKNIKDKVRYIVIQYIPDADYIDIFKVEAEDFENAWLKVERCVRKRLFSEIVLLTDKQFIKLVKKNKKVYR